MKKPNSKEKVCYNCNYISWLIGVGQGLRCCNPKKEIKLEPILSRFYTCDLFEEKNNITIKKLKLPTE
jgi:hypothetical protein